MRSRSLPLLPILVFVLLIAAVLPLAPAAALPAETLWQWRFLADPELSPDGRWVIFTVVEVDRAKDGYRSDLWRTDLKSGSSHPFTTHPADDSGAVWSPDGKRIAFVSTRSDKPQIFVMPVDGGEAHQVTAMEAGAGGPVWSPDGRRIAFVSTERTEEEKEIHKAKEEAERQRRETPRKGEDGEVEETAPEEIVVESLIFRRDGSPGFRKADRFRHIWVVDLEQDEGEEDYPVHRLTHGDFDHGEPAWAKDGDSIFFSAVRKEDAEYTLGDSEIYQLTVNWAEGVTEEPIAITDHRGRDSTPMVSPDGRWLAYLTSDTSEPPATYEQRELMLLPLVDGKPEGEARRLTTRFDRAVGSGVGHDVASPRGGGDTVRWAPDSGSILFTAADRGQAHLYRASVKGTPVERLTGYPQGDLQHFSIAAASEGGNQVAVIFSTPKGPLDLYSFPLASVGLPPEKNWQRHTDLNDAILEQYPSVGYEEITYPASDGKEIQGWVLRPPTFDDAKKYPLILYIHGGPHSMYGTTFFHEFQMLAREGYVVLITNPRGSTGYGLDFATSIQYAYPGDDVGDLMAGVDFLLEKGYVDEGRMGVAGGSGGGLLTSWIVGHTDRFAAAAAQRNVTNWRSFAGTSDVGYMSTRRWFRGSPWQDQEGYLSRSPITYADRITTPLLLIHSDQDYRTPLEQSEQLYSALKAQKKETRLVVFPGESHGLSRGGRPSHRIARLEHILGWFDRFLKDQE